MQTHMASHPTDVYSKALALNLEQSIYGTFAEIGTGQEVARWYLGVGAASGTVAQTISAYDKTVAPQAARQTWYPNSFRAPIANNEPWLSSA